MKDLAEIVKLKWRKRAKENNGDRVFLTIEEAGQAFNDLLLRTQSALGRPIVTLGSTITKSIFSASVLVRLTGRVVLITVLAMLGVQLWHAASGEMVSLAQAFNAVIQNRLYQALVLAGLILNARHIVARLTEPEVGR